MLELAYLNKDILQTKFASIVFDDKYKFLSTSYVEYMIDIKDNSWDKLQFVSKDKSGKIIGYFSASTNRQVNAITNLFVANFYNKSATFSRDFYKFWTDLFIKFKFSKINWSVYVGNPAEKMYDRIIEKYGGRVAAYFKNDMQLYDGTIVDHKMYELTADEFRRRTAKW